MSELTSNDIARLRRSNRRLLIAMLGTVGLIVLWLVLQLTGIVPFVFVFAPLIGGFVGCGIGALLVVPQRRLLRELGISAAEARSILDSDKELRKGTSLSPPQRARRARIGFWIWLAVGLLTLVVLAIAAAYFFAHAGQTHPEGAPLDPWFVASFFVGFAALIITPAAFMQTNIQWRRTTEWQRAAADPAPGTIPAGETDMAATEPQNS